jgi:sigma-B regulation protein RsbU (phosphoserine phosphatase)
VVARRPLGLAQDASFIATVEAIGGIVVERKARGGAFSSNDLAVLETLAADAAVAIDSARLYREAREKAKIDYEMSLARTIQSALLRKPEQPPFAEVSASSQPARIVGGDLYHTAIRDDGSLAFALGDVSGKGVAAALIMTMIQGLLSVLHELGLDLAEIPEILNRNLALYNPGNRFLTLAMGTLRPDGSVQLVNAGHCPVVILRSAGSTELIQPGGPVLGILPGLQWEVNELHLQPGDSVVIYSDGVSESFSPDRIEFGVEGVARTLEPLKAKSPDDVARLLLEAAVRHRAGREADDDVTIMVVRYRGQA